MGPGGKAGGGWEWGGRAQTKFGGPRFFWGGWEPGVPLKRGGGPHGFLAAGHFGGTKKICGDLLFEERAGLCSRPFHPRGGFFLRFLFLPKKKKKGGKNTGPM